MSLRALLADTAVRLGIGDAAFNAYQRLAALRGRGADKLHALPPAYLRVLTAGDADPVAYRRIGAELAERIVGLAEMDGRPLGPSSRVLEFGCGCGRVAAPLLSLRPVALTGCDINPELTAWCAAHLKGAFLVTQPDPPLPFSEQTFDVVYATSVFTHMTDARGRAWFAELSRVVRPGGRAVISFLDDAMPGVRAYAPELADNGFAVKRGGVEGSNLLTVFHTHAGLAARAGPGWRRLHSVRSADLAAGQALALFERV